MLMNIIRQGSRARAEGYRKDASPFPEDSRERRAWMEGYEASSWAFGARVPHPARRLAGTTSPNNGVGGSGAPVPKTSA
ncbi:hypothetical protein FV220_02105 [Methylobacterium sp. WL19]|nr:hypothetical protein FV220_02105 [Methylobacterium sp. WL19]